MTPEAMSEATVAELVALLRDVVARAQTAEIARYGHAVLDRIEATLTELQAENERLRRERDAIGAALGEPCAECGHIDWRSDGYADRFLAAEAALAQARGALERAGHELDQWVYADGSAAYRVERAEEIIRTALAPQEGAE
jgi:hypothetical protein